jgi:hypothetical protein
MVVQIRLLEVLQKISNYSTARFSQNEARIKSEAEIVKVCEQPTNDAAPQKTVHQAYERATRCYGIADVIRSEQAE